MDLRGLFLRGREREERGRKGRAAESRRRARHGAPNH